MKMTLRRLGFWLAALTVAGFGGTKAQAQWWTCPAGQGDFDLQTASNDRVRCFRQPAVDQAPSICPNRDTASTVADRCQVGSVGAWGPAVCPAAVPPYVLTTQPGADVCRRTLPGLVLAPTRKVP